MYSLRFDSPELCFTAKHGICYCEGNWEELHEHRFRVVAVLSGTPNSYGYLVDFHRVSKIFSEILGGLHGRTLLGEKERRHRSTSANDFRGEALVHLPMEYVTTELLAQYVAGEFLRRSRPFFTPSRLTVEVEETPGCWGIYTVDP